MRITRTALKIVAVVGSWHRAVLERRGEDPERGDVPGWVFVTMMSAALATALYLVAGPALTDLLTTTLDSVLKP